MGMGLGELLLIGVILAVLGYMLAVPIVGIVKAVRRKDRAARSTGAVVWSSINVGLFGLLVSVGVATGKPFLGPSIGVVLNAVWLFLALQANRAAPRSPPA